MKKIGLFFFIFYYHLSYAQQSLDAESFRKLSNVEERFAFLSDTNVRKMSKPTFDSIFHIIQEKKDYKTLFYWYYQFNNCVDILSKDRTKDYINNIHQMRIVSQKPGLQTEATFALYLFTVNEYSEKRIMEQQAYSTYLSCFEQIKSIGTDNFKLYGIEWILLEIGRNFYELGDIEKALECLLLGEKTFTNPIPKKNLHFYTLITNLIESIYANKREFTNASFYAQKIYDVNLAANPTQDPNDWLRLYWQGLSCLNMADYLFEVGKFKEGETLADKGYKLASTKEDLSNDNITMAEFEALQVLIKIKLKLGKIKEVEPLFKRVEILKPHLGLGMEGYYFKPIRLYKNYVTYYEIKKDYINAYRYMKLANELQDSLNRRNDKRQLWQTEMRVKADRYQAQLVSAEEDYQREQNLRNAAIIALVLFAGVSIVVYRRIKNDNKIITEQKTLLQQSLTEKETLLKEVHHRVKNNLQIISSLFDKQSRQSKDEVTRKLMKEGQDRVFSIALVHQNLYQSENLSTIEIKPYLETLTRNIEKSQKSESQNITLNLDIKDSFESIDTIIPLGLILNELITNCYKYAFTGREKGSIAISFHTLNNAIILTVKDDGIGLPPDFNIQKNNSLGMNLVRGLVRQLNGQMDFTTSATGTTFIISCKK